MAAEPAERSTVVVKIMSKADWDAAVEAGQYDGSADDARDGFIHLSTPSQVIGTLSKHYAGRRNLVALAFQAGDLGPSLKWEVSRGGELFPHLYAPLPSAAVRQVIEINIDDDGRFVVPGMEAG